MCPHIHTQKSGDVDLGILKIKELLSTTRCQCNQYCKHSSVYESQFQDFQNITKFVLSQLSLLNLVSWPTPYWFERWPIFEAFDSFKCLSFHSLQNADRAHGLPKTWLGLLHHNSSRMHPEPAVWRAPFMVCGSAMQATRFQRLQVLIAARLSSSDLRRHCQL